ASDPGSGGRSSIAAPLAVGVVLLALWHVVVWVSGTPPYIPPSPLAIAASLWTDGPSLPVCGPAVAEPMRLHVPARRYLCATDPGYFARLSPGSVRSLELQGGPFTSEEVAEFRALPFAEDAIRIRRWDEAAKVPGIPTADLEHY